MGVISDEQWNEEEKEQILGCKAEAKLRRKKLKEGEE